MEPSATELQELYNAFGYILTEERAILDAPPTHIDLDAFRSYLERLGFDTTDDPQPDAVHDLRNRDVVVEVGGELRATLYGVLAFGRDPQRYARTRDFRIECVAYAGVDRAAEVLQVASAAGRVDEQVDRATGWFLGLGRFE
ncbi:MAG: transcriptional regulator, partial [Acidobacteria bacterium]|nr:transcriptional regulator [Acidobacteriota bacterium]